MTRLSRSTLLPVAGLALLLASPTLAKPTAPAPPPDPLARTLDGLDYTVQELIDHFKGQPTDFEPGERYQYDNCSPAPVHAARGGWEDRGPPKEGREVALSPEQLQRCVGRYELAPGFVLEVTRERDRLFSQATGQERVEIFAEAETEFFLKVVDAQLSFQLDGAGRAKALVLHQGGRDITAKRLG